MMYLRGVRRSTLLATMLVALIDAALLVVVLHSFLSAGPSTSAPGSSLVPPPKATTSTTTSPPSANSSYRPLRVQPPQTAVERAVNQRMTETSQQALSMLATQLFPSPAVSSTFGAIDAGDSQSATLYGLAFTQELLDIDFATSTRNGLLAWANYNNSPDTLMGLPTSLSAKVLCASLTTGPSPVPTARAWNLLAKSRVTWRASGLVVSMNPAWTAAMNSGWTSIDPLMVIYDVSGLLTVTTPGHPSVVESIAFGLTLGGATLHPGYGAVALNYWTVN